MANTTSGTTTFDKTFSIDEIIEEAFERLGIQNVSGYQLKTSRRSLNIMLQEWGNRGIHYWEIDDLNIDLIEGQSDYDFTHKIVSSVNTTAGVDGYFNTRIVVDHDSSAGNPAALLSSSQAILRGSFMVAAYGDGTGTLHYQQVQSNGGAS